MEISSATMKRNAGLIYGVIITLGVLLSSFVYLSTQKAEKNTLSLVEQEIPIFEQLQRLDTLFIEEELYLNEYYANQNRDVYLEDFKQASILTKHALDELHAQNVKPEQIQKLKAIQKNILDMAVEFDQNMEFGDRDTTEMWDLARQHLESFAMYRQEVKPIVEEIIAETNQRVEDSYLQTRSSLTQTSQIVLAYSVMILIFAIIIGRYVKSYIFVSVRNKRLALFPQRNPNPILSLDSDNHVAFANPATHKLLRSLNLSMDEFCQTMLNHVEQHQVQIREKELTSNKFEFALSGKILDCELHWLQDLETWDLHLVDVTKRKEAEAQIAYQAFHRVDTGLLNRNKFVQSLEQLTQSSEHVAIGSMEIRHYSQMVSRLGFESANNVVNELADLLARLFKDALSEQDYEFFQTSDKQFSLIINTDFCVDAIDKLVKTVESAVESKTFCNGMHTELDFGFCCYPEHANSATDLIRCVNIALDHAIAIEHSSLVMYDKELGDAISKEIELAEQLRIAIEKQHLTLHFQPQLDIRSDKIVGVETLIRWPHEGGFIPPVDFIPLAEKTGLIIPLGQWIVTQACIKAKSLIVEGYTDFIVAINISPQQFQHPSFFDMIVKTLEETKVPPENIELEITEGVIMYNEAETILLLHKLKELGLKLSIDDFGTGYSSLSYLKQFPIDKLKIDQSFIKNIDSNNADKAIVNTVVDLANNLELTLIAEGVEESSHLSILKQMGCQEIQGYFFSKPLPEEALSDFLQQYVTNRNSA